MNKKKIVFIVNVDWFFVSHRLPIAISAVEQGYDVHLICSLTDKKNFIESFGINVHNIELSRSGLSIINDLKVLFALLNIVRKLKPDICHFVTVKCVIYGGFISRFLKVKNRVASISGLGYLFIDKSIKTLFIRFFVKKFYKLALGSDTTVIFQNEHDRKLFVNNHIISKSQTCIIRGSGVDLNLYRFLPEPVNTTIIIMFVARLLKDKGFIEFCNAAEIVKKKYNARFVAVGDLDSQNPSSLSASELSYYVSKGIIEHWGFSKNIESIIPMSNIMVLPSYREGLPKSLLEAAACGRAVITTDVPGCRDAILPNKTGLLVKSKDSVDLAKAIFILINDTKLRSDYGKSGRLLAEKCFDINNVVRRHLEIYIAKESD